MKVIVFGSTGTIGKHVVEQCLEKGYEVSAFSRGQSGSKNISHHNLKIVEGDVLSSMDVQTAIKGVDLVCIVLGSGKNRTSTVRSEGTKIIIDAMKTNGVKRLICQSTLGAGESNGNLNFFWKHIMFGWFLKQVFLDHELQEEYVKKSRLEWIIVRPGAFTDGEKTQQYKHGFSTIERSVKLKISRADVADFILKQFDNSSYLYQTPGLSY